MNSTNDTSLLDDIIAVDVLAGSAGSAGGGSSANSQSSSTTDLPGTSGTVTQPEFPRASLDDFTTMATSRKPGEGSGWEGGASGSGSTGWLLNDHDDDALEIQHASAINYTIEEVTLTPTETASNATFLEELHHNVSEFIERNDWVLWTAVGVGTLCVLIIAFFIGFWIYKHKKRVILEEAPGANGSRSAKACLCCCFGRGRLSESSQQLARMPSESNLEAYKRPSMPPIQASYSTHKFHEYTTPVGTLATDGESVHFTNLEHAVDIAGINGVPTRQLRDDQYRPLPEYRGY